MDTEFKKRRGLVFPAGMLVRLPIEAGAKNERALVIECLSARGDCAVITSKEWRGEECLEWCLMVSEVSRGT